jgi:hypothetical protein
MCHKSQVALKAWIVLNTSQDDKEDAKRQPMARKALEIKNKFTTENKFKNTFSAQFV